MKAVRPAARRFDEILAAGANDSLIPAGRTCQLKRPPAMGRGPDTFEAARSNLQTFLKSLITTILSPTKTGKGELPAWLTSGRGLAAVHFPSAGS